MVTPACHNRPSVVSRASQTGVVCCSSESAGNCRARCWTVHSGCCSINEQKQVCVPIENRTCSSLCNTCPIPSTTQAGSSVSNESQYAASVACSSESACPVAQEMQGMIGSWHAIHVGKAAPNCGYLYLVNKRSASSSESIPARQAAAYIPTPEPRTARG